MNNNRSSETKPGGLRKIAYAPRTMAILGIAVSVSFAYLSRATAAQNKAVVPLNASSWVTLAFNKTPPNKVTFANDTLTVKVKDSAGPIVHKLEKPIKVVELAIKGKVIGSKKQETSSFDEDSVLRVGLVAVGQQTLSGPKRWFAADWVKKLFALAPAGTGLDKIYFFSLTNRQEMVGKERMHPKSDLISENIIAVLDQEGHIDLRKKMDKPIEIAAVWLSIDGDDTKSEYETTLNEIELTVSP